MSLQINHAEIEKRVAKRINKRTAFYIHATAYVVVNVGLWIIWAESIRRRLTAQTLDLSDGNLVARGSFPWPIIVMLNWGLGLAINAFQYFAADAKESMKQREIVAARLNAPTP